MAVNCTIFPQLPRDEYCHSLLEGLECFPLYLWEKCKTRNPLCIKWSKFWLNNPASTRKYLTQSSLASKTWPDEVGSSLTHKTMADLCFMFIAFEMALPESFKKKSLKKWILCNILSFQMWKLVNKYNIFNN